MPPEDGFEKIRDTMALMQRVEDALQVIQAERWDIHAQEREGVLSEQEAGEKLAVLQRQEQRLKETDDYKQWHSLTGELSR